MSLHRTLFTAAVLSMAVALFPRTSLAAGHANPRRTPVVDVVERVKSAVVNIQSERMARVPATEDLFGTAPSQQSRVNGMGTGILVDPRGYIVTNHHVVEDVSLIRVRLCDGSQHGARVVARDAESDLALLKIDAGRPLPVMPLGTASDLMVGETVIAIGNAYGYDHTVTVGVVSAVKRDVTLNKDISYKSLIQTDASINPGNSGGPLLNINGDLIGVNVAIRAGAQGIGFAIPVDSMMRVVADLLSIRKRNGTWHGLVCRDIVEPAAGSRIQVSSLEGDGSGSDAAGLKRELVVERIDDAGPAAKAGVQRGDVVLQVADAKVACALELERALLDRAAGDKVPVLVRRDGKEQRLELVLQSVERSQSPVAELIWRKLGVRLLPVSAEVVARSNNQLHGGLAIVEIRAEGAAARAGLQRGDVLVGLHQWETLTVENVAYVLQHPELATFTPLRFFIVRARTVHRGWVQQLD
jgi:serine protease Do